MQPNRPKSFEESIYILKSVLGFIWQDFFFGSSKGTVLNIFLEKSFSKKSRGGRTVLAKSQIITSSKQLWLLKKAPHKGLV